MPAPVTLSAASGGELTPLIPHPIEIVLAAHVLLVLAILVVLVTLVVSGSLRRSWQVWVGVAVLLLGPFPFVGPLLVALLLALSAPASRARTHTAPSA